MRFSVLAPNYPISPPGWQGPSDNAYIIALKLSLVLRLRAALALLAAPCRKGI